MSLFRIDDEDTIKVGKVSIPMNPDLWRTIMGSENPSGVLADRAIDTLRLDRGYSEAELEFVRNDALFMESTRTGAERIEERTSHLKAPPKKVVIEYGQPGTRDESSRETKHEEEE